MQQWWRAEQVLEAALQTLEVEFLQAEVKNELYYGIHVSMAAATDDGGQAFIAHHTQTGDWSQCLQDLSEHPCLDECFGPPLSSTHSTRVHKTYDGNKHSSTLAGALQLTDTKWLHQSQGVGPILRTSIHQKKTSTRFLFAVFVFVTDQEQSCLLYLRPQASFRGDSYSDF
jgi:muramidase (phage lysozyme)